MEDAVTVANMCPFRETFKDMMGSPEGRVGLSRFSWELYALPCKGNSWSTALMPGVLGEKSPGVVGVKRAGVASLELSSVGLEIAESWLSSDALSPLLVCSAPS